MEYSSAPHALWPEKMAATLEKKNWYVEECSRFVESLYDSYQSSESYMHSFSFWKTFCTCSSYMLNALITLPISNVYVLHQHVSSIVYLRLLHLCRKWLPKVLCFNKVVNNIVYCEPFKVQPNAQSSSMGFIYHVLHHTLTVSVIRDFNHFIMHKQYTPVFLPAMGSMCE